MWGLGQVDWCDTEIVDYEYLVKQRVEIDTEDYDEDYYCLYYTANKDINWDMINKIMYRNYMIGVNYFIYL
jgi:hypothetical protein